nr:formimidoylglutamase [Tissierella sp.]
MLKNYETVNLSAWEGRVDSEDDFDSFRWHQWVEKLDLSDKELKPYSGKLGFAFLGFKSDAGVKLNKGRTGAAKGPESIRRELRNLPCQFSKEIALFDAGDISCIDDNLEEAQDALALAVEKLLDLNLFPILLGGGHEIAFGHYKGILNHLKEKNEEENIGIINFDAHFDLRPYSKGGTSGTMFKQIADTAKVNNINYSYFCIGIQKHGNTASLFNTADELGVDYILAKDIVSMDSYTMIEKLDDFLREQDHIYLTVCSDVFSSAFAPGVSAPQPLGLDPDKVLIFLKYILRSDKTISFDIAEVSPRFDQDDTTANLASVIIFSVVHTLSKLI